jgi:Uma2 family endonuclease
MQSRLIEERRRCDGADRYDEVWEGLYVMAPIPNDEHQDIQMNLGAAIKDAVGWDSGVLVRAGVNVSDRDENWTHNYRVPDVVVFLPGNPAVNHGTHWQGGPDFLVEIISRGERPRKKLPFYAKIGVREVLIVNRKTWTLELYSTAGSPAVLQLTTMAPLGSNIELRSNVLPMSFQLRPGTPRPRIQAVLTGSLASDVTRGRSSWSI